jgi:membrane-bound ClpP family serine protease
MTTDDSNRSALGAPAALCAVLLAGLLVLSASDLGAQEAAPNAPPPARSATLVRLQLPLAGNADAAFRGVVLRAKSRLLEGRNDAAGRPVLVIELAAGSDNGAGSDFARAFALARFLTSNELAAVKTVAYVPETIVGHGVLVALACEEIAISPGAELGPAGIDEPGDRPVDGTVLAGYRQIARARLTAPEAVALGLVDPALEVIEFKTEQGIEFATSDERDEIEARMQVVSERVLFAAGALGSLSGREARQMAVAKYLVDSRDGLARVLRVPAEELQEAGGLVADWRPIVFDIDGPITMKTLSYAQRLIFDQEVGSGRANFVLIRINSTGGNWSDAQQLASFVASLPDRADDLRVVTYVPREASGSAALVALAGQQLVMHPDAKVGGLAASDLPLEGPALDQLKLSLTESLAEASGRTGSLLVALADPAAKLFRYVNRKTAETRLLDESSAAALADADDWQQGAEVTAEGNVLSLSGDEALELGVAAHNVTNFDDLLQIFGISEPPREVKATWSLQIADALSSPAMQVLLLVLAFVGIYFELNTPGMGVGGFIAALAILLFFWSKALHGTVEWLEVLLFLGGVVSVLIEFFVLPGIGIFGIGGGIMIVAAIILAGQRTILPSTERDWANLEQSLIVLLSSAVGVVVATILLRRFLPHIPVLNSMLLGPPDAGEASEINSRESLALYAHLVGQRGTAATPLMPGGKMDFDGDLIDVVTRGEPIDRGATVEVVAVQGHRVTVKQV